MNYLSIDIRSFKEFKEKNARKVDIGNRLMRLSHLLRDTMLHMPFESFVEQMLVQEVFHALQESLLLAMRGQPTMCFAMIRIGMERCRDLLRILEDPALVEVYISGRNTKEKRKKWRESFIFDEERDAALFKLYNICSDFGVHARMPLSDSIGEVQHVGGSNFVAMRHEKSSKDAFVLALKAINICNIRISQEIIPLMAPASDEAQEFSTMWLDQYSETSNILEKYLGARQSTKNITHK